MQQISANGVRFSCRFAGDASAGRAALLIHGLNANLAFWRPELVRALGEDRRLLMYDLRGHGHSELAPIGYTSAEQAGDAQALLDAAGFEDAIDVVAHSFGATVALQLARLHPERVRSLVLLDPRCRLFQPELRLGDWPSFARWRASLAEVGVHVDADTPADYRLPLVVPTEAIGAAAERLSACGFFSPSRGPRSASKYRQLLTETTAGEELADIQGLTIESLNQLNCPTQLVFGDDSMFLPSRDGMLDAIPHSRCQTLKGVGHNFPFLRPDETAQAITAFWHDLDRVATTVPTTLITAL